MHDKSNNGLPTQKEVDIYATFGMDLSIYLWKKIKNIDSYSFSWQTNSNLKKN